MRVFYFVAARQTQNPKLLYKLPAWRQTILLLWMAKVTETTGRVANCFLEPRDKFSLAQAINRLRFSWDNHLNYGGKR